MTSTIHNNNLLQKDKMSMMSKQYIDVHLKFPKIIKQKLPMTSMYVYLSK